VLAESGLSLVSVGGGRSTIDPILDLLEGLSEILSGST
jgi:hypothetical protein